MSAELLRKNVHFFQIFTLIQFTKEVLGKTISKCPFNYSVRSVGYNHQEILQNILKIRKNSEDNPFELLLSDFVS